MTLDPAAMPWRHTFEERPLIYQDGSQGQGVYFRAASVDDAAVACNQLNIYHAMLWNVGAPVADDPDDSPPLTV